MCILSQVLQKQTKEIFSEKVGRVWESRQGREQAKGGGRCGAAVTPLFICSTQLLGFHTQSRYCLAGRGV